MRRRVPPEPPVTNPQETDSERHMETTMTSGPRMLQALMAGRRERVLIIGSTPLAREIARELHARAARRYVLIGIVHEPLADTAAEQPADLCGTLAELPGIV